MSKLVPTILAHAGYLPTTVLTNDDLAAKLDTSDAWIMQRTGIAKRHIVGQDEHTATMAKHVACRLLEQSQLSADDIDMIIVATSTPSFAMPSTASFVHAALGSQRCIPAFDINAACSGFVYGLMLIEQAIASGSIKHAMLIGADTMSQLIDWQDRTTCVLFGDGAGGLLFGVDDDPKALFSTKVAGHGQYAQALTCTGPCINPSSPSYLTMQGREVFKKAVKVLEQLVLDALNDHHLDAKAIDWLVPHQANIRIIEATARYLGLPMEQVIVTIDQTANTTAASIPLAFDQGVRDGRIQRGSTVLMEAFGAGFTWGYALLKY